jgi:hypothetical protein
MRRLILALLVAPLVGSIARGDEAADLCDRVLKAHAKDPADLKKFRVHTMKAKGISRARGDEAQATCEIFAVWPGQMRLTWEWGTGDKKTSFTVITTGDRGWQAGTGMPSEELRLEMLNDVRTDIYAIWVATLTTLKDAETRLALAGGSKVGDAPVLGLKVSRRPWPDITLYFDEKSGLLRKMAYRSREGGVFLDKEFVYDGHKDVDGLKVPTKQITRVGGIEIADWTEIEYSFPEKIDSKKFEKP